MKETYFTLSTIADKAAQMLSGVEEYTRRHAYQFHPARSALLVLDMQSYFLDESSHAFVPSASAILPGINALIRAYSQRNLPVFITRHVNSLQDAGLMAGWWRDLLTADHPLSPVDPRLEIHSGITVQKIHYDAFLESPLSKMLQERDVRQVVICGVMTHLCCETTARSSYMRGFEVFFTVDGTATYNEAFHHASLLNLAHGFATPVLVGEILTALERSGDG